MIRSFVLSLACAALTTLATAQTSLDRLRDDYQQRRMKLFQDGGSPDQQRKLATEFVTELEGFLANDAKGLDRFNGRLMLVDFLLSLGERERAEKALTELKMDEAPPVILAGAAEFAAYLEREDLREQYIAAAIAADAGLEDRMALAAHLMTRLGEIAKGEQILEAAMAAAKTDEDRARVAWFSALAIRDREDLPEGAYDEALDALAKKYPNTRYGSIATDRNAARKLEIGDPAIPLAGPTLSGERIALSDLAGKVVIVDFWASWRGECREAAPYLAELLEDNVDEGLAIIGVNMDERREDAERAVRELGMAWPHVFDGQGFETEVAQRYSVDVPPRMLVIGRDGKIAALHLYPYDDESAQVLGDTVKAALAQ